jgi:hypothetical protein
VGDTLKERAKKIAGKARAFNDHPPIWAYVVTGLVIWIAIQTVKFL